MILNKSIHCQLTSFVIVSDSISFLEIFENGPAAHFIVFPSYNPYFQRAQQHKFCMGALKITNCADLTIIFINSIYITSFGWFPDQRPIASKYDLISIRHTQYMCMSPSFGIGGTVTRLTNFASAQSPIILYFTDLNKFWKNRKIDLKTIKTEISLRCDCPNFEFESFSGVSILTTVKNWLSRVNNQIF